MKPFFLVRVWWKLFLRRFMLVDSFCKCCGVDVRDFRAPDDVWDQVLRLGGMHRVLCYNCFCDKCEWIGVPTGWRLSNIDTLPLGNMGTGEPGSYKKARGCLADDEIKIAADALYDAAGEYIDQHRDDPINPDLCTKFYIVDEE